MFAPRLYTVRSYPLKLLIENNYELGEEIARDRKYSIKQQDSQMLRQLRLITGNTGKFVPHIVFVDSTGVSKYEDPVRHLVIEGIVVDGHRFLFGERSASMTRTGIFSFVRDDVWAELNERITMGIHLEKTVLSKYYAYRGLFFSSCHCLDGWRPKVIVVPDCELTIKNQRIKHLYDAKTMLTNAQGQEFEWTQKDIKETVTDIDINAFDGCGLIHPSLAKEIEEMIGSKTPVTSMILRAPYIKGCVHAIDYPAFFAEHGVEYIRDVWGRWHDASEPMLILTASMYKGAKYFGVDGTARDWDNYWDKFERYQHCFGIAKWNFSFDEEPMFTRMNYQILQDLDLPYDQFASLANDSREWVERIIDGDPLYTYCFLGLTADRCNPVNAYAKAVLKNPEMLKERSVRRFLRESIRKYADDMKCGKLWALGSFKFLVPDLIAMMEHIGGLPVRGCLESDEFYSRDKDGFFSGKHLVERNPHICRSEHALMNAVVTPDIERYVGDLSNIAMVNCKSLIMQRLNGADTDGDIVLVLQNDVMVEGVDPDVPIVLDIDDKITAVPEPDTLENRATNTLRTMASLIGKYSNYASVYHNKTPHTKEQKDLYNRYVDIISICVGKSIDAAKCGVLFKVPNHIARYAKPLPYFMKYRKQYYAKQTLSMAWSNMNRLCIELEKWHKKLTWRRCGAFDYHVMIDESIRVPENVMNELDAVFKEFNAEMRQLVLDQASIREGNDKAVQAVLTRDEARGFVIDWEYYYDLYRKRCLEICPDIHELANACVLLQYERHPRSESRFGWVVAEAGILDNIKQVHNIKLPKRDRKGTEYYLGRWYSMVDVDMTEDEDLLDCDFSIFDETDYFDD